MGSRGTHRHSDRLSPQRRVGGCGTLGFGETAGPGLIVGRLGGMVVNIHLAFGSGTF